MDSVTSVISSAALAEPTFTPSSINATLLESTIQRLPYLPLTARDWLLLPLRLVYRAEVLVFVTIPSFLVRILRLDKIIMSIIEGGANFIGGFGGQIEGDVADTVAGAIGAGGAEGVAAAAAEVADGGFSFVEMLQNLRRFGGFVSYMTSKWSIGCFLVALVLNRVTIFASTRRHLSLKWNRRLLLRIIPIVLFATQIVTLLRASRCQTSPNYALLRYGKPRRLPTIEYAGEGGFLYKLSSFLLQWEDEEASCRAVSMARPTTPGDIAYGSFNLLWPAFLRLCIGQFAETLSCALQGRPMATETGMSIFEYSLAFAEAETMLTQSIGLGLFGNIKPAGSPEAKRAMSAGTSQLLTRNQVLGRLNVTPELLLITMISSCNSLASNILDIFGKQSRYRLINTTVWGLCFMASIMWGIYNSVTLGQEAVLRFPTVCIVGFVPHLLILVGILACGAIYVLALLLTAFSLPSDLPRPTSFRERLAFAHANMQGSTQVQNVRFNFHDDFYTTLVRIGYSSLTAASEAVFLNEGKRVVAKQFTWLEEDRLAEILESRFQRKRNSTLSSMDPSADTEDSLSFKIPERRVEWRTGYSQEKRFEKRKRRRSMNDDTSLGSIGAFQGPARLHHGYTFFKGIFSLILGWAAFGLVKLLGRAGIVNRPQWLIKLAGTSRKISATKQISQPQSMDFWILTDEGVLELPDNNEFDVEKEMRKREMIHNSSWGEQQETVFERKLYNWWKSGGAWGERDESEDYVPSSDDWDDNTSVVSVSTNGDSEWESDVSDGRKTPTQDNPYPSEPTRTKSTTPDPLIDTETLARLLDPKDRESRLEARILSSHLLAGQEGKIMTRSQFKDQIQMERARVLMSNRLTHTYFSPSSEDSSERRRPSPEEEVEILEKLILSRRQNPPYSRLAGTDGGQSSWETGASGLGSSGPQCVVCQAAARSIITWPCRCLCICEECRVSLAMNNFGSCVTCRREVAGFVRLWVP